MIMTAIKGQISLPSKGYTTSYPKRKRYIRVHQKKLIRLKRQWSHWIFFHLFGKSP